MKDSPKMKNQAMEDTFGVMEDTIQDFGRMVNLTERDRNTTKMDN